MLADRPKCIGKFQMSVKKLMMCKIDGNHVFGINSTNRHGASLFTAESQFFMTSKIHCPIVNQSAENQIEKILKEQSHSFLTVSALIKMRNLGDSKMSFDLLENIKNILKSDDINKIHGTSTSNANNAINSKHEIEFSLQNLKKPKGLLFADPNSLTCFITSNYSKFSKVKEFLNSKTFDDDDDLKIDWIPTIQDLRNKFDEIESLKSLQDFRKLSFNQKSSFNFNNKIKLQNILALKNFQNFLETNSIESCSLKFSPDHLQSIKELIENSNEKIKTKQQKLKESKAKSPKLAINSKNIIKAKLKTIQSNKNNQHSVKNKIQFKSENLKKPVFVSLKFPADDTNSMTKEKLLEKYQHQIEMLQKDFKNENIPKNKTIVLENIPDVNFLKMKSEPKSRFRRPFSWKSRKNDFDVWTSKAKQHNSIFTANC